MPPQVQVWQCELRRRVWAAQIEDATYTNIVRHEFSVLGSKLTLTLLLPENARPREHAHLGAAEEAVHLVAAEGAGLTWSGALARQLCVEMADARDTRRGAVGGEEETIGGQRRQRDQAPLQWQGVRLVGALTRTRRRRGELLQEGHL